MKLYDLLDLTCRVIELAAQLRTDVWHCQATFDAGSYTQDTLLHQVTPLVESHHQPELHIFLSIDSVRSRKIEIAALRSLYDTPLHLLERIIGPCSLLQTDAQALAICSVPLIDGIQVYKAAFPRLRHAPSALNWVSPFDLQPQTLAHVATPKTT